MPALDPDAELLAALTFTPEELAALDATLVEMKRDADAAFEELARNRDAADAQLVEMAREGAAALEETMRNHPRGEAFLQGNRLPANRVR